MFPKSYISLLNWSRQKSTKFDKIKASVGGILMAREDRKKAFKFKSLLVKMLATFLPIILVSLLVLSSISVYVAYSIISHDSDDWLETFAEDSLKGVQKEFVAHQRIAESLSEAISVQGKEMTVDDYKALLERMARLNSATLGAGVWFEPYEYQAAMEYFGPYVYKEGDSVVYTQDYSTKEYDYPNQDWYVKGKEKISWSTPYYDDTTGITMVTTSLPMKDSTGKLLGTVTADIDLSTIQQQIKSITLKESGYAVLIDNEGNFISHPDQEKVMKVLLKDDEDLSSLAEVISEESGHVTIDSQKGKLGVYYVTVPETGWKLVVTVPESELYASVYSLAWKVLIATLVALVLVSTVIVIYSRKHTAEIGKISKVMEKVAAGDLTAKVKVISQDEVGQLALRLNETTETIKSMVLSIYESAHALAATSEELNVSSDETNKAIREVAISIQNTAHNTEDEVKHIGNVNMLSNQVFELVKGISKNTVSLQEKTTKANVLANNGIESINEFIEKMRLIQHTGEIVSDKINQLNTASEQIEGMVNLIDQIADQTNLLALNASIEAARAGEQGKGFAVVADEVRKLANESSNTSSKIKDLIHEVQLHVRGVVEQMAINMDAIQNGIVQVEASGGNFEMISKTVDDVVATSQETSKGILSIEQHVEKLKGLVKQVNELIEETNGYTQNVSAATEEQAASVDEITSASESLSERAMELEQQISRFKID